MSGHSKWATTHRLKEGVDKKRGKIFSRMVYAIRTAAQTGGGNPNTNARLRTAIEKAKQANMPKKNIERALAHTHKAGNGLLSEARYEIIGPEGSVLIVDTLTDNRNRTLLTLKTILGKYHANFAEPGATLWQFDQKGIVVLENVSNPSKLEEDSILGGADDIQCVDATSTRVLTKPSALELVRAYLEKHHWSVVESKVGVVPKTFLQLSAPARDEFEKLLAELEKIDEVQEWYTNVEFSED